MPSKEPVRTPYLSRFLNLKCAGDVLNATCPINSIEKEITESMSIIRYLKNIVMKSPGKYTLYDMGAGNALTSVIAAHLLPIKHAFAVDRKVRKRPWERVREFTYMSNIDIHRFNPNRLVDNAIIIGVHACGNLAESIVNLYMISDASHLVLMPCCVANGYRKTIPSIFVDEIGKHAAWAWHLSRLCDGKLHKDDRCLSARNLVITASKEARAPQERDLVAQLSKAHRDTEKVWREYSIEDEE